MSTIVPKVLTADVSLSFLGVIFVVLPALAVILNLLHQLVSLNVPR